MTRTRLLCVGAGLCLLVSGGPASAQAVLELDLEAGRRALDSPEYQFREFGAVDYERRLVYAVESMEPLAVAAHALDDGSVVGRYGGREGEGPGELLLIEGVSLSPQGVFAAGGAVVNHWATSGALLYQWRPVAPGVRTICSMDGSAAVAGQQGVVVRAKDGRSVAIGADTLRTAVYGPTGRDAAAARTRYRRTLMSCADSVAYVLSDHVITAYRPGESARRIPVPPEVEEVARRREAQRLPGLPSATFFGYDRLLVADRGQLVLTTLLNPEIAGAVIDPATGCYELLKTNKTRHSRHVLGMMADSVVFVDVVAEPKTELVNGRLRPATRMVRGKATEVVSLRPRGIAIRPVRLVSGERCPVGPHSR